MPCYTLLPRTFDQRTLILFDLHFVRTFQIRIAVWFHGMIFISLYCYLLRRSRVNDDIRLHVEEIKLFAGDWEHCRLIFRTECANVRKKFGIIFSLWLTLLMISHVNEELKIVLCSLILGENFYVLVLFFHAFFFLPTIDVCTMISKKIIQSITRK